MEQKPDPLFRGLSTLLEGKKTGLVLNLLIVVLVILALLLPPVSAQERIFDAGYKAISREAGGSVQDRLEQKVQITLLPEGLQEDVKVKLQTVPKQVFMTNRKDEDLIAAAQALTTNLHVKSDIYKIALKGEMPSSTIVTIPIPNDAEPYEQISLYDWTGQEWEYLPSQVIAEDDVIEARLDHLPRAVAVLQNTGQAPIVSAELPDYVTLPESGEQALAEVNPLGYYLDGNNSEISGKPATLPASSGEQTFLVMPTVRNWYDDGLVRSDWIDNLLVLAESQDTHIAALAGLAEREMYAGIDLDYRGISPDLRAEYTSFVTRLAEALHAKGKRLTVHVEMPTQIAADRWETGAYDWQKLGAAADRLKFPAIQTPSAYADGGQMEALLWWAVGQVDRARLQPVFTARSVEDRGGTLAERTYRDALAELSDLATPDADVVLTPGQEIKVELEAAGVLAQDQSGCYSFTYKDDATGQSCTVWLEDASSLARKLALVRRFSMGGIAVRALWDEGNDPRVWDLVREYQAASQSAQAPAGSEFAVLWTVANNGQTVNEETTGLDRSSYTYVAQEPGQYAISAAIVANGGKTVAGGDKVSLLVALPTDTPTPVPTETPLPTSTPTPEPTATPKPTAKPAGGGAAAPKPTAVPGGGGGQGRVNTNFGYGIQIDPNDDLGWVTGKIKGMGFGWAKFQAPWMDYEPSKGNINWGNLDGKINGLGDLKIMLSIVKAPHWARGGQDLSVEGPPNNPQDFADFLGAVAGRYCGKVKAIEVWNEQNLHYEWGNMKIDPAAYIALLKPAYNAIKRACPGMIVVSGALTPTGAGGRVAMDDFTYLEGMYKAGLKGYCDAVGAHPSGYNVGPTTKWTDACTFITQNGNSFNGPCRNAHHSWSFYSTLNGYHGIMAKYGDGNKKIWPTEFGWATNWLGDPNYGYAQDNSPEEQAAWTVKAYQLMKSWGWVGTAFLWNLNFKVTTHNSWEGAQWGIINVDRSNTQTYNSLAAMAK